MKRILTTLTITLAIVITSCPLPTSAVGSNEWVAGRIIDDGVFTDKNSMSVGDIQTFLNNKVPSCDTYGQGISELGGIDYNGDGKITRREYAQYRGYGSSYVFTCLKDYYEVPKTSPGDFDPASNYGGAPIPTGAISAAQIIYNAAQKYTISPRVLLIKIHTESAGPLTVDDWPFQKQYLYAMGAHCPDTPEGHKCDPNWRGFSLQLDEAAALMRSYLDNMQQPWWTYKKPYKTNDILWQDVNVKDCGSGPVYISSKATAALYTYTPYQPDADALNNMYGTGGSCSTYGNRNFWRYFRDWFGSNYADPFMWQNTNLYVLDENKNIELPTDNLHMGERLFVVIKGINMGTETWYRDGVNPARLGLWNPKDQASKYCDYTWLTTSTACNRAGKLVESVVPPNGVFHFEIYMHAPNEVGEYREYYRPVLENRAWMTNETGFHIYIKSNLTYDWQWLYYDAWTDSTKTTRVDVNNLQKGQEFYVELKVKNKSATVWTNDGPTPTRLGTRYPQDGMSPYCTSTWIACNRLAALSETSVAPGQIGTFAFTIKAPSSTGEYRQYLAPVMEYKGWMRPDYNHIYIKVTQ